MDKSTKKIMIKKPKPFNPFGSESESGEENQKEELKYSEDKIAIYNFAKCRVNKVISFVKFSYQLMNEDLLRQSSENFLLKKIKTIEKPASSDCSSSEYEVVIQKEDKYEIKEKHVRYFTGNAKFCCICRSYWHEEHLCPTLMNYQYHCKICLSDDHTQIYCDQILCHKCNNQGHVRINCVNGQDNQICKRCFKSGHSTDRCGMLQTHQLQENEVFLTICIKCNRQGHINCSKTKFDNLYFNNTID